MRKIILALACFFPAFAAHAEGLAFKHALVLYGKPKYGEGFKHFDYVNPQAPKGGDVKLAETGTFDSLNGFIVKGVKAPGITTVFESLMIGSLDEPQTLYGLLAEKVALDPNNKFVEFIMRTNPQPRFHDGSKLTAEDVVFSFNLLKEKGDPTYRIMLAEVKEATIPSPGHVRFTFTTPNNRELALLVASLPVFSKTYYTKHDFEKATLTPPLASGPYQVADVDPGRAITYRKVKDYWGENLPVNIGQNNFATIRYDMYRDENVTLEALKAGAYDWRQEYIARNWATAYDSPALKSGKLIKVELQDKRPQGMQSFLFNTRRDKLADRRVREAIGLSMDYEWLNRTIFYGAYKRNTSFFLNTQFAATGVPEGAELELLKPYADILPPELFTKPFQVPVTDGNGLNRDQLLQAKILLEDAGWIVKNGKRVNAKTGQPLTIEFMMRQPTMERVVGPMRKNLERLGIDATIRMVDDSQYQKRIDEGDFDVISVWLNRGIFFPGNEQMALWHSSQADVKGSANTAGVKNKAVDGILAKLVAAKDLESLEASARALDRVLLWEHYVIPHWHSSSFRVAYWNKFGRPKIQPPYNTGFQTWWIKQGN